MKWAAMLGLEGVVTRYSMLCVYIHVHTVFICNYSIDSSRFLLGCFHVKSISARARSVKLSNKRCQHFNFGRRSIFSRYHKSGLSLKLDKLRTNIHSYLLDPCIISTSLQPTVVCSSSSLVESNQRLGFRVCHDLTADSTWLRSAPTSFLLQEFPECASISQRTNS